MNICTKHTFTKGINFHQKCANSESLSNDFHPLTTLLGVPSPEHPRAHQLQPPVRRPLSEPRTAHQPRRHQHPRLRRPPRPLPRSAPRSRRSPPPPAIAKAERRACTAPAEAEVAGLDVAGGEGGSARRALREADDGRHAQVGKQVRVEGRTCLPKRA